MAGFPSAPKFTSRVPVQFLSDDKPGLSITGSNSLFNNPKIFTVKAGNMAKVAPAIDGTTKISGQGEYAPFALVIQWPQLGYNDYLALSALVPYNLTFISFRNVGYYGRLILDGPSSDKPYTSDVVSCQATFLVMGPSDDGGAASVNRLAAPSTFTVTSQAGAGFIGNNVSNTYFLTFHTKWGETTSFMNQQTTGGSGGAWANSVTWSWPSSTYCTYASLYCAPVNAPLQALLMAEILSGQSPSWTDLVGFAGISPPGAALYQTPPLANNAYTGFWAGGRWANGS